MKKIEHFLINNINIIKILLGLVIMKIKFKLILAVIISIVDYNVY